jgi:hypothetical protein
MKFFLWLMTAFFVVFCAFHALAQEHNGHPPQDQALHEQFYSNWLRPDANLRDVETGDRMHSCCSMQDCAPVDGVEYREGNIWMLRHKDQRWIMVPPEKIESNYPDRRESPDTQAHMCSSGVTVFCAVLGGGV